jgi:putative ABC transport system substrate-binding protein
VSHRLTRRALLLAAAAAFSDQTPARAHPPRSVARVGYVATTLPLSDLTGFEPRDPAIREFLAALTALGWSDGKNVMTERRSAEGHFDRFGDILRDLVSRRCDVIVTTGTAMTEEALRVTTTVPIVATSVDLQRMETLVKSLARPGGNLTGMTGPGTQFEAKKFQVFKEAVPRARRIAVLEPRTTWDGWFGESQRAAARALGLTLIFAETRPNDYAAAFDVIVRARPDAIHVGPGIFMYASRSLIIDFANRHRLPLMGQTGTFTEDGGLISYATDFRHYTQRAASYVDRILRGARAGDLPIEQPSKFELVINLQTARALGLMIPESLLVRADRVIQ